METLGTAFIGFKLDEGKGKLEIKFINYKDGAGNQIDYAWQFSIPKCPKK